MKSQNQLFDKIRLFSSVTQHEFLLLYPNFPFPDFFSIFVYEYVVNNLGSKC